MKLKLTMARGVFAGAITGLALSACVTRSSMNDEPRIGPAPRAPIRVLAVQAINPDELPAVEVNGVKQRILQLMLRGSPDVIVPLKQRLEAEGWRVTATDNSWMNIDTAGHSLEQFAALKLELENRRPVDLTIEVMMRSDADLRR
ncbi:MAG: hypothetical protein ABIS09_06670 [Sphingomicrobium sp.]